MKNISIFVDVQNIYYTTKQHYSKNFNYNKFWKIVTKNRNIISAFAYTISKGDRKQTEFQNILRGIGFNVKLKPFIKRKDGSAKGDWDVGIAIDIIEYSPRSDLVVLASGDGDFDLLLDYIKKKYKTETEVFGVPALTSKSLIKNATIFNPIDESYLI